MENLVEYFSDLALGIYKALVDAIDSFLPATPESMKLANIFGQLISPDSWAFYFLAQALEGVAIALTVAAVYKLIKILPLT